MSPHALQHLVRTENLGEVVVGANFLPSLHVLLLSPGREHGDAQLPLLGVGAGASTTPKPSGSGIAISQIVKSGWCSASKPSTSRRSQPLRPLQRSRWKSAVTPKQYLG